MQDFKTFLKFYEWKYYFQEFQRACQSLKNIIVKFKKIRINYTFSHISLSKYFKISN